MKVSIHPSRREHELAIERLVGTVNAGHLSTIDPPASITDYRHLLGGSNGRQVSRHQTLAERDGDWT